MRPQLIGILLVCVPALLAAQVDTTHRSLSDPNRYADAVAPDSAGITHPKMLTPCRITQLLALQPGGGDRSYFGLSDNSGDRMSVHPLTPDHSAPMPSISTGPVQDQYPKSSPITCQTNTLLPTDSARKPTPPADSVRKP